MSENIANGHPAFKCNNRSEQPDDPGYFLPVFKGALNTEGQQAHISEGRCFSDITYTLHYDSVQENGDFDGITLEVVTKDMQGFFCGEYFVISTRNSYSK